MTSYYATSSYHSLAGDDRSRKRKGGKEGGSKEGEKVRQWCLLVSNKGVPLTCIVKQIEKVAGKVTIV